MSSSSKENKYCKLSNLRNESDVEQFFVSPFLKDLGYEEDYIETKATISEVKIGKRRKQRDYRPDYVCYSDKKHSKPVLVIDAKSRNESAEDGVADAQHYSPIIRRGLDDPKPTQYCIGTNGDHTIVKHYESNANQHCLDFEDFQDGNEKFEALKANLNRSSLSKALVLKSQPFEFTKPDISEVTGIFEACHNVIRRKEGMLPQPAFWEFSKLMFVKINEDKKLREDPELRKLIHAKDPLLRDKIPFSLYWIGLNEYTETNPINTILFKNLRDRLEYEIINERKKRIFEKPEQINLKPETIKEIVRLLEHLDLYGIDDDLNGKLFETFLSSTMIGKELGQLFTPRTVVDFMTELADIQVGKNHIDRILDACCGTGGFLIEAMAVMDRKIRNNPTLSSKEKTDLVEKVSKEYLFGIDFGKDPPIARIARINMYLHEDGGSRIYFADALDKNLLIEDNLTPELKKDREELKRLMKKDDIKFDVVLTNPPFAMKYSRRQKDDKRILEQYTLSEYRDKKGLKKHTSLDTSTMFIERYYDLLKPKGKLLTVIDESVLNTDSDSFVRDFILENFLVKAIISLPRETFKRAGANVKTSILYLVKKEDKNEEQPYTFYAKCDNSGNDPTNAMKIDASYSDLNEILEKYNEYQRTGKI